MPKVKNLGTFKVGDRNSETNWKAIINEGGEQKYTFVQSKLKAIYRTDARARTNKVVAHIKPGVKRAKRNNYQQKIVGKYVYPTGDQGGHFLASVLGGPGNSGNLTPMNRKLNQGQWRSMERKWQKHLRNNQELSITIDAIYTDTSRRPSSFRINYTAGGVQQPTIYFINHKP
jgi:filamentous hemagglutinin